MSARDSYLKRTYGIGEARYEAMLVAQRGVCRLCGKPPRKIRLSVDHQHALTGLVRGLLCSTCNRLLGAARDNAEWLFEAAAYITLHTVIAAYVEHQPAFAGRINSKARRKRIQKAKVR